MEDKHFDELTKKLAAPVSRRTVFRAAVAAAAGGMGALLTFGRARAQNTLACHGAGTPCAAIGHNNECCTGYCPSGRCACQNGQAPCVSTVGCPTGFPSCELCVGACPAGQPLTATCSCNGVCCSTGETCINGTCCPTGQVCGTGVNASCSAPGETCINGISCPPAQVCGTGTSATCCASTETCCNGVCQTNNTTTAICGGTCCSAGSACCGTACCPSGRVCCNGTCCNSGSSCVGTTCCAQAQVCGTACCTNYQECFIGTCRYCSSSNPCPTGYTCENGGCFKSCPNPSFFTRCGTCTANCTCWFNSSRAGGFCVDAGFFVGRCSSDADCPQGTFCSFFSSGGFPPHLCTRPCPCPA